MSLRAGLLLAMVILSENGDGVQQNRCPHTISALAAEESRMHLNNGCARTPFLALSSSRQACTLPFIMLACGVSLAVASGSGPVTITTTTCPGGTQGTVYAGCTISASGGNSPYTFSVSTNANYPPLPEGLSLNATTGRITSSRIGGQGTYGTLLVVRDATNAQATREISFSISGNTAFLANIFPASSIFLHRVDAATTGLPVDTSPAARFASSDLNATIMPFFGHADCTF